VLNQLDLMQTCGMISIEQRLCKRSNDQTIGFCGSESLLSSAGLQPFDRATRVARRVWPLVPCGAKRPSILPRHL
jgi:hypothetical protein